MAAATPSDASFTEDRLPGTFVWRLHLRHADGFSVREKLEGNAPFDSLVRNMKLTSGAIVDKWKTEKFMTQVDFMGVVDSLREMYEKAGGCPTIKTIYTRRKGKIELQPRRGEKRSRDAGGDNEMEAALVGEQQEPVKKQACTKFRGYRLLAHFCQDQGNGTFRRVTMQEDQPSVEVVMLTMGLNRIMSIAAAVTILDPTMGIFLWLDENIYIYVHLQSISLTGDLGFEDKLITHDQFTILLEEKPHSLSKWQRSWIAAAARLKEKHKNSRFIVRLGKLIFRCDDAEYDYEIPV